MLVETTLGYLEKDGAYLMLHRNKKENDLNQGKWIGVGGHIEQGESPDECFLREVFEETGIKLLECTLRGEIEFISDTWESERMYLYSANTAEDPSIDCEEGTLKWIKKSEIFGLNLWQGDKLFLEPLIAGKSNINMKLIYHGDDLVEVISNE